MTNVNSDTVGERDPWLNVRVDRREFLRRMVIIGGGGAGGRNAVERSGLRC